jgi:TatD DNase family protein
MDFPVADAHIHLADLLDRDPGFPERLAGQRWRCCASSHGEAEWERVEALRGRLPPFLSSFGIHPQNPVWKDADFLARLAAEGRIAAIGEAGFDFYADEPERTRNAENEGAQRAAFEYQLELAERLGLPLLLHLRKAMDLAFAYAPRLRRIPAAIFHSFPGSARDAESLLARGVPAYFSFGAPLLNGNKRAAAACAAAPAERLLAETDAPWQPPRRMPERSSRRSLREGAEYCRAEDIGPVVLGMARIRDEAAEALGEMLVGNFERAYGVKS